MGENRQFYRISICGVVVGKLVLESDGTGHMIMDAHPGEIYHVDPKCVGERWLIAGRNAIEEGISRKEKR